MSSQSLFTDEMVDVIAESIWGVPPSAAGRAQVRAALEAVEPALRKVIAEQYDAGVAYGRGQTAKEIEQAIEVDMNKHIRRSATAVRSGMKMAMRVAAGFRGDR